jgi:hypothetical protein
LDDRRTFSRKFIRSYALLPILYSQKIVEDHGFNVKQITSDAVKLGKIVLVKLGRIIPSFGVHIIIHAEKI